MRTVLLLTGILMMVTAVCAFAQEMQDIALPAPRTDGGKPLMQALMERRSSRDFSDRALEPQVMSDLLWAAAGINRPDEGKRTAPSARNWQEIEVYAVTANGAYLYDAKANVLRAVASGDLRKASGMQPFVSIAPLNLVYVADATKMEGAAAEDRALYMGADAAFIAENVYLFCASQGLATVVRGSVDRTAMSQALKLPETKTIVLAQTIGYPGTSGGE